MANSAIQIDGPAFHAGSSNISATCPTARSKCASNVEAALYWYGFGFHVIPLIPNTKFPAVKWDPWLKDLSTGTIQGYWDEYPDHQVGFIVGDNIIVFDADSSLSIAALMTAEKKFGITPALAVTTRKGLHHYYGLAQGTYARSDSHCTEQHPTRIDVKTGRAMVILPPSPGKEIVSCTVNLASEISIVSQDFIDAIFQHNGRDAPRPYKVAVPSMSGSIENLTKFKIIKALINCIYPDSAYDNWLSVGMVIHHETEGSDEGLALFDKWSSKGNKYKGNRETLAKWKSFRLDHPTPLTINTLKKLVADNGHDWRDICSAAEEPFELLDDDAEGDK